VQPRREDAKRSRSAVWSGLRADKTVRQYQRLTGGCTANESTGHDPKGWRADLEANKTCMWGR
jgi:hypothetical protein